MLKSITLYEHQPISYQELGWPSGSPYPDLLDQLNNAAGDTIIQVGRKSLKATQYVGVIRVLDLTIEILPKIDYEPAGNADAQIGSNPRKMASTSARVNLLQMLAYAENLKISRKAAASLSTVQQDWFELLIRIFALELQQQILQGPYRAYVRIEDTLPVMRGKWLIAKQLAQHPHQKDRFDLAFDEFTLDNPLNRVFRYTVEILLRLSKDPANRKVLTALRSWLIDVSLPVNITPEILQRIQFTRINDRYWVAYNLAVMFLEQEAMLLSQGKRQSMAFVLDMNRLFEKFVEGFLQRHKRAIFGVSGEGVILKPQSRGLNIHLLKRESDQKNFIRLRPDLLVIDELGRIVLVLDTKYKRLVGEDHLIHISEGDLYQMLAYLTRFNCKKALLLYPSEINSGMIRRSYYIPDTDKRIYMATLNLHQPLNDTNSLIREFQSVFSQPGIISSRELYPWLS
jgi:5-methylcytosine-specific restriction enzyme subunit McrC